MNVTSPATTIPNALRRTILESPDAPAVVEPDRTLTYAQLGNDVDSIAKAMIGAGVADGDRVAALMANSRQMIAVALAITSIGAVFVPINTRFHAAEIANVLRLTNPQLAIVENGFVERDYLSALTEAAQILNRTPVPTVNCGKGHRSDTGTTWDAFLAGGASITEEAVRNRAEAVTPESTSDLLLTSGTSGSPRVVAATHGQTTQGFGGWGEAIGLRPTDRQLLALPMFQGFGYKAGVVASVMTGSAMVPQQKFDPAESVQLIANCGVTVIGGSPTILSDILEAKHALTAQARIRLAVLGTAFVPPALVDALLESMCDDVLTGYGLTECCGPVSMHRPGVDREALSQTVGRPIDALDVRIDGGDSENSDSGVGEILVRGYCVMSRTAGADAVDADGWLHTGDLGRIDAGGNLVLAGRKKEMLIVGGFNVYPAEIEALLRSHPGVSDVAVVGMPDARLGEVACAYVIPQEEWAQSEDELIQFCRDRISNYKAPREIRFARAFPRNPLGKVIKSEL